jgi:hypothetical protein
MELKELQNRLTASQEKLNKITARVNKWFAQIATCQEYVGLASSEIYTAWQQGKITSQQENALGEYRRAKYDLQQQQILVAKYEEKVAKETAFQEVNVNVPALNEFLQNWRKNAYEFYVNQVIELTSKINALEAQHAGNTHYTNTAYRMASKELRATYKHLSDVADVYTGKLSVSALNTMLDKEVVRKQRNFVKLVSDVVGTITDVAGLYVANNLEINGVVIGTKAKANVQTITAGGWNIQCLHFRVLVHEVK